MKLMLSFFWICVFQWTACSAHFKNPLFARADSLYATENYRLAMVAYERIIYVEKNETSSALAALGKVYCHKKLGEQTAVDAELQRLQLQNLPDSLVYAVFYEKTLAAYLTGDYQKAENDLLQLNHFVKDSTLKHQCLFLDILVLNELQRWEEAKLYFKKYLGLMSGDVAIADRLYTGSGPEHLKSSQTARRLSYFLPGSGQIYASGVKEGVLSMALNAALIGLGIGNFYAGYYYTSAFIGAGLLPVFYWGGAAHAVFLVKRDNEAKIRAYNDNLKKGVLAVAATNFK